MRPWQWAFMLMTMAEKRWRRLNSPHLVALVHAGVKFPDGKTKVLAEMMPENETNLQMDAASPQLAIHNIRQYLSM